ncbi:hypothetical protein KSS87_000655, partial [Heliosperma pusillum]
MVRKAIVSEDEGDFEDQDVEREDDDEDGLDEYEKDDFIVDDVDEEDEEELGEDRNDDGARRKKKKRKKDFQLDEDDVLLLQEANIPISREADNKFKRLKKVKGEPEEEHSGFSDDDDGDMDDEDDMDDFIVEDADEAGPSMRRQNVKKSGQATGVSSSGIQDAHEIFGDVQDLLNQRRENRDRGRRYDETGEGRLEDEFEPSLLVKKYMTETDDQIRENDIPERIQISERSTGPPSLDVGDIKAEATWIRKQLEYAVPVKMPACGEQETEELEDHIRNFLNFIHVQKLDLPFVAMYRKENISSLLKDPEAGDYVDREKPSLKWHKVLWAVRELDKKWLLLQKRKNTLLAYYNKRFEEESRRIYDDTRLSLNKQLFVSIVDMLDQAESEREVDDVDSKFNLHFSPGEAGVDEGKFKTPKRKSHYGVCNKAGLWEVASKFGCSSEQFGLQISSVAMKGDEFEDLKETPEEVASNFTCAEFDSPQSVLKGARHMIAVEISCEPCVKKHFRSVYFDNAVVSTCPTTTGNTVIDVFHQFAGVKWLRNKPLNKFEDAQWLLIQKAEAEKLLQVTIKLPDEILSKLMSDSQEKYLSCGVSSSAQLWNEQRKLILEDAILKIILPALGKEARLLLTSRSKNWLLMEYGKRLWDKVSVAPYRRKKSEITSDDEVAPRVMTCCWGPGKPATTFVMLDSFGEIVDVLEAGSISLKSQNVTDQQRKKHDQQNLLRFMTEHQPEVVVLGATNFTCTRLKENIYEIVFKMVEENPRDMGHDMDGLSVFYGDESLPRVYENSHTSSEQIPSQQGIVKRAVALGRYIQNPLAMVAALCGTEKEILSWKLSPLESFLNADEKYEMVEQIMVDVTNQVGLDLNLASNHEWLLAPLKFISGLGPRKAASLHRSLLRAGAIVTRKDLLTSHGLGRKVFISAAGFLRIRRSGLAVSANQFVDILDDTRIHPESYALAQAMTKDIYKAIAGDDNLEDDDDAFEMTVENLRDRPSALGSFSVDEYAKDSDCMSKIETLHDIKREMIQGFQDWRKPYEELSQDDEFHLISGENDDSLGEGRIVKATVRRVQAQRAICSIELGLSGMLTREDYSDDCRDSDLTEKLHEGDVLTCKIKSILKDRYQVFLTCREQDMRKKQQNLETLDPYYHEDQSSLRSEEDKARKEKELARKHFKPRMIVHPHFQNITADEAMEFLAGKDPGESLIRPSSRGPSYLTLTLKIHNGVYAHKDILEGGKDHKDIASLLRIGKTLKIGEDTFEDLDESVMMEYSCTLFFFNKHWIFTGSGVISLLIGLQVVHRYVDPLVGHLKAVLNYRKFKMGTKAEIDEILRAEKLENPMRIAYCFSISHEHPGALILTYIRSSNPHHEYIGLYPKGLKFRKQMFEDVNRLMAYFQQHINDPIHESQSIQ